MNKLKEYIIKTVFVFTFLFVIFSSSSFVYAVTPTLSLSANSDGDSVVVNVSGDPNASVLLYYLKSGTGSQISSLGTTNTNGSLSVTISSSSYGLLSSTPVHISTGGISGPVSSVVNWPNVVSSSSSFNLSQTGMVLTVGQTLSVTANNTSGSLFVSNNSNPQVANFSINGNQINVTGNVLGSTVATFCVIGNTSNCPSVYVTVQNTGVPQLTFSQNTVAMASGQNSSITISGGTGIYLVSNNSNSSAASASISGSTVSITAGGTNSSSSLTICSTDMSSCGVINIVVGQSVSTPITFSQASPSVSIGQSATVSIYGPTNSTFYISSNSNSNVVQATLSGSTLTLYGITSGSSTINVCSSLGGCGSIYLTVNYIASGGAISISQSNINILTGQTLSVTVSGGTAPYSIINPSVNIAQGVVSNNLLTISGLNVGSDSINVCSAAGGCTSLVVTVNNVGTNNTNVTNTTGGATLSVLHDPVSYGNSVSYSLSPSGFNNPSYSVKDSFSGTSISSLNINSLGNFSWIPNSQDVGIHIITFTASDVYGHSANTSFTLAVVGSSSVNAPVVQNINPVSGKYIFTSSLVLGNSGQEVTELQAKLKSEGVYSGPINGKFGKLTLAAVKKYQKLHGLAQRGNVGPGTRAALNK